MSRQATAKQKCLAECLKRKGGKKCGEKVKSEGEGVIIEG